MVIFKYPHIIPTLSLYLIFHQRCMYSSTTGDPRKDATDGPQVFAGLKSPFGYV